MLDIQNYGCNGIIIIIFILPSVAYDPEGWQKLDRLQNTKTLAGMTCHLINKAVSQLCIDQGPDLPKYLTAILRLSYDNAKVTIDLQRTSNLQKHPTKGAMYGS